MVTAKQCHMLSAFQAIILAEQMGQPLCQRIEFLIIYVPIITHHSTIVCMIASSKAHGSHHRNAFVQEAAKQTHNTTRSNEVQTPK